MSALRVCSGTRPSWYTSERAISAPPRRPATRTLMPCSTQTHGVLNDPPHRASELHPTFELLSDVLRNQQRVELRLADLFDVDVNGHSHQLRDFPPQTLDIFAFLTDDNAGAGGVNRDPRGLRRTFDLNATDRRLTEAFAQKISHLEIVQQVFRIVFLIRIPDRGVVFDDAEAYAGRVYFLSHSVLLVRYRHGDVTGPL